MNRQLEHHEGAHRARPNAGAYVGAAALFLATILASCGGSSSGDIFGGGLAGADASSGGTQTGGGLLGSGGGLGGQLNPPGGMCSRAGQSAPCWTGAASQRNVSPCHDGTTTCVQSGEFAMWGPCQGEQTNCPGAGGAGNGGGGGEDGGGNGTGGGGTEDGGGNGNGGGGAEDGGGNGNGGGGGEDGGGNGNGGGGGEDGGGNGNGGGGGECVLPDQNSRCPPGYYGDANMALCCPCAASDCGDPTKVACCTAAVCASSAACADCAGKPLDATCMGQIDFDCDDWPEDCDQLCCPCKPVGICVDCPGVGQIACAGSEAGTDPSQCVDGANDPDHCGACDGVCAVACVNASCQ